MAESKIDLSFDSQWVEFVLGGYEFQCEVFEVIDLLVDVDRKHASDPHHCLKCNSSFSSAGASASEIRCTHCGSEKYSASQLFLDSVVELLKSRFGVPRCSRSEAARFYSKIIELHRNLKKNSG